MSLKPPVDPNIALEDGRVFYNAIEDFGVHGNGTDDDTATINSAISYLSSIASSTNQIRLFFPTTTNGYLIDAINVKSNIWLDFGSAYFKKKSNNTPASITTSCMVRAVETLTGGTYYGTYSNIKITGGHFDGNGKTFTHCFRLLYVDGLTIDGVTIEDYGTSQWAFNLGGRNGLVTNCRIKNGVLEFSDGIHISHGQHWRIIGNDIYSGDDCVALGGEPTDAILVADPDPIRYVTVAGNTGRSYRAFALKLYVQAGATGTNWEVTDVDVTAHSFIAGYIDNGGIRIKDYNAGAAGTSQIKRINVDDVTLNVGSVGHLDNNVHEVIHLASVQDVTISNAAVQATDKTGGSSHGGFDVVRIESSQDVNISGLRITAAAPQGRFFWATDSDRISLRNSTYAGPSSASIPVRINACTDFKIEGNQFDNLYDGQAAIQITEGTGSTGVVRNNRADSNNASNKGYLLKITAAALTRLDFSGNDISGLGALFDPGNTSASEYLTLTTLASATTVTLPVVGDFFPISGTTTITSVVASWPGRRVTLEFAGALTFTDGSNLKLAGNFVTTADDTISLVSDGTNWYETARSAN